MKKYLSLFIVLLIVFGFSIKNVRAEDQTEPNDVGQIKPTILDNNGNPIPPNPTLFRGEGEDNLGQKVKKERVLLKDKKDALKKDFKDLNESDREALKQEMEQKREQAQKDFEQKRETMKQAREAIREEEKSKIDALKTDIQNEKDATKAKIKEDRVTSRAQAFDRFTKMEDNLVNLKDRVNAQIISIDAKGIDTTKAKTLIATVETNLTNIKTKITTAGAIMTVSIDAITTENKTTLKTLTEDIQKLINDTHKALNATVKLLKDAVKTKMEADKEAANSITPTTPTNTGTTN